MKALLVDDSKAARFAMGKLLKDQGLEVEMAESGEEALEKITTQPINIVFMDQSMPGMGGIAATKAITSNEKTSSIPVVLCTGNEGDKLEQMAREAGAIGVLTKPPREEALKKVLSSIHEAPAAAEEFAKAAAEASVAPAVDMETILAEVDKLLEPVREQITGMEQALEARIDKVARSAEQGLQPLQATLGKIDERISAKVKEQMSVDASNQRIQLEALRQQVNSGLDEMEEREGRLRDTILQEVRQEVLTLVVRKLEPVEEAVEKVSSETIVRAKALERKVAGMEKALLGKSALIAVLAAGAAFAAAFFLA